MALEFLQSPFPYAIGAMAAASAFTGVGVFCSQIGFGLGPKVSPAAGAAFFRLVYPMVKNSQMCLIAITAIDAAAAAYLSSGFAKKAFIAAALVQTAILPFTKFALIKLNYTIIDTKDSEANEETAQLLQRWSWINAVRPALSVVAVALTAAGLYSHIYNKSE